MNKPLELKIVPFQIRRWSWGEDSVFLTFMNGQNVDAFFVDNNSKLAEVLLSLAGLDRSASWEEFMYASLDIEIPCVLAKGTDSNILAIVNNTDYAFVDEHASMTLPYNVDKPPIIVYAGRVREDDSSTLESLKEYYGVTEEELISKLEFNYNNGFDLI
ncbi:MAG: hypothetical protein K2J20_02350 [Bacilli bacterium]|nr:hypothetical protein [Bacilli bacterium]